MLTMSVLYYVYLVPVRAVPLDVSLLVTLAAAQLLMPFEGRSGAVGAAGVIGACEGEAGPGVIGCDFSQSFGGGRGALHMAVAVSVLPSDLGKDPVEGVRLLEVREGLLRVCHLGGLLTHQFNDEVLGALGEAGVVAV